MKTAARVIITGWEARLDFRAYHFCFTKSTKIVPNWNNIVLRLSIIEKYFHHNCFLISQIEFILTFLTTNYYHFFSKYVQNLNLQSTILILLWLGDSPIAWNSKSCPVRNDWRLDKIHKWKWKWMNQEKQFSYGTKNGPFAFISSFFFFICFSFVITCIL